MNNKQAFFRITVVLFAVVVSMLACKNPAGQGGLAIKSLTIAGTFDAVHGGGTAQFSAANVSAGSGRAIGSTDYELAGLLEDGDITIKLKGNYNSATKTYSLSAAADTIGLRYTISGTFNNYGIAETGKAVVQVRGPGDVWTTTEVPVTTQPTAIPIIEDGSTIDDTPGGIPLAWRGIWRDSADASYYAMVNAYSVIIYEKSGSNWVESETLYFTDILPEDGGYSGITGFFGWDYDKLNIDTSYQWNTNMLIDFAKIKYPGKTPVTDVIGLRSKYLESLMTGDGGGLHKVEAAFAVYGSAYADAIGGVNHDEGWTYMMWQSHSDWMTDSVAFNAEFSVLWQWVVDNKSYPEEFNAYLKGEEYKNKLAAVIANHPALVAKYQITLSYKDEWDLVYSGAPLPADFSAKFQSLITAWANSNGYIIIDFPSLHDELWAAGYEEIWLNKWIADNGKNKADYYVQFYQKMLLKLQGSKLYYGQYYKPAVGGTWNGGFWMPNGPGDIPPVWAVNSFALTSTLTQLDIDYSYGLSR